MEKLVIIGGGPAGLAAAIYAARAGLNPLVIEGVPSGGQLMLTTEVENYPGFAKGILGPELIAQFREQALRFKTRFVQSNVTGIELDENKSNRIDGVYRIKTEKKVFQTSVVLITTGADAIWMGLESEQRLRGRGVSACATCDGFFFRDKTVAVIGGGDSAMEEALTLTNFAKKVYVIHRRSSFRASKIMADRVLKHNKIEVIWDSTVTEVLGTEKVEGVRIQTRDIAVDGIFVAIGHKPATEFLRNTSILLDKKGYIVTSAQDALLRAASHNSEKQCHCNHVCSSDTANQEGEELHQCECKEGSTNAATFDFNYPSQTSVPGIFAAGDCVDHRYRQAATAVGMGVAAELEIERYLTEKE